MSFINDDAKWWDLRLVFPRWLVNGLLWSTVIGGLLDVIKWLVTR